MSTQPTLEMPATNEESRAHTPAPEIKAAVLKDHHHPVAVNDVAESTDEVVVVQNTTEADRIAQREKAIAERAAKRAAKLAENHARAEEAVKVGDEHLEKGETESALTYYLGAVRLWTSNPAYYTKLAEVYIKLEFYEDAAHAATRALTLDPTLIEARYQRGIARLEQRLLRAAKIDFETILKHTPTHAPSLTSLTTTTTLIENSTKLGAHTLSADPIDEAVKDLDFAFPHYTDDKLEVQSVSDSSDCGHVGNGVPCRFYNHEGCKRGTECLFSHAPDEKSVRDDLGRNVCIYHLLSTCKFGTIKCVYSHSKVCLPKKGWWTSEEEIKKVKDVLEMAEKSAKEQRALEGLLRKLQSQKKRGGKRGGKGRKEKGEEKKDEDEDGKKDEGEKDKEEKEGKEEATAAPTPTEPKDTPAPTTSTTEKKKKPNRRSHPRRRRGAKSKSNPSAPSSAPTAKSKHNILPSAHSDGKSVDGVLDEPLGEGRAEFEERSANGGFTDYELNDLGVKPCDDDAHAVSAALNYS